MRSSVASTALGRFDNVFQTMLQANSKFKVRIVLLFACVGLSASLSRAQSPRDTPGLAPVSFTVNEWIEGGETTDIPWEIRVEKARLRMDQRIEVAYAATFKPRDVTPDDKGRDLLLMNWIPECRGRMAGCRGPDPFQRSGQHFKSQ